MKKGQKNFLRAAIFSAIVAVMLLVLNAFFQPVWLDWNNFNTTHGFYEEPENSIETVFLGSSVAASGIIPTELYDEYGMCSYNLATEQQPVPASYYWLQEAYALHKDTLKTVVFDVSTVRSDDARAAFYHKAYDPMRLSEIKINAVRDFVGGGLKETLEFMVPLIAYHGRWSSLNKTDFEKFAYDPDSGSRGYYYIDEILTYKMGAHKVIDKYGVLDESAKASKLAPKATEYLIKMVEFCKEKNIKLLLIRTVTNKWSSGYNKAFQEFSEEHDVEFVDFNYTPYYEEGDYNNGYDTRDGNHLNYFGATKFTKVLGKYLVENCEITDVRNNPDYDYMKEQSEKHKIRVVENMDLKTSSGVVDYIATAMKGNNTVFITVMDEAAAALTTKDKTLFNKLGLKKLAKIGYRDSYIGIIENGKVVYENSKQSSIKDKKPLEYKKVLNDGRTCIVISGGKNHGNKASVSLNHKNQMSTKRGINILVYNNTLNEINGSINFDTNVASERDYYGFHNAFLFADEANLNNDHDPDSTEGKLADFRKEMNNLKESTQLLKDLGRNNLFDFLDYYLKDKNNTVLIALHNQAAEKLTDKDRQNFAARGLVELSKLEKNDAYVAYIKDGKVVAERRANAQNVYYFDDGIYLSSNSPLLGKGSSIDLFGDEKCKKDAGLNFVVYNEKENTVLAKTSFNTAKNAITY